MKILFPRRPCRFLQHAEEGNAHKAAYSRIKAVGGIASHHQNVGPAALRQQSSAHHFGQGTRSAAEDGGSTVRGIGAAVNQNEGMFLIIFTAGQLNNLRRIRSISNVTGLESRPSMRSSTPSM